MRQISDFSKGFSLFITVKIHKRKRIWSPDPYTFLCAVIKMIETIDIANIVQIIDYLWIWSNNSDQTSFIKEMTVEPYMEKYDPPYIILSTLCMVCILHVKIPNNYMYDRLKFKCKSNAQITQVLNFPQFLSERYCST